MRLALKVEHGPAATADLEIQLTPFVGVRIVDGRMEKGAAAREAPML